LFPGYPDQWCRADLLDQRVSGCEPSGLRNHNRVHWQPKSLLGTLGGFVDIVYAQTAEVPAPGDR
jgi:hypothetical protein